MMKKRLAALLLCLAMVLTMAPVGVLAEDGSGDDGVVAEVTSVSPESGTQYATFTDIVEAFAAVSKTGGTLTLLKDVPVTDDPMEIRYYNGLKLDLNGHTLRLQSVFYMSSDLTIQGGGTLECEGVSFDEGRNAELTIGDQTTATLNGITASKGLTIQGGGTLNCHSIYNGNTNNADQLTISETTVNLSSGDETVGRVLEWDANQVQLTDGAGMTISGEAYMGGGSDDEDGFRLIINDTAQLTLESGSTVSGYNPSRVLAQLQAYLPGNRTISLSESGENISINESLVLKVYPTFSLTVENATFVSPTGSGVLQLKADTPIILYPKADSADELHSFSSWKVNKGSLSSNSIQKMEGSDNYQFTMPDSEVELEAVFDHKLEIVKEEKQPTCEDPGNIAYWRCSECEKYFNGDGEEISVPDATVPASGHKWGEPSWTWSDDYTSATARFICGNVESHTASVVASQTDISSEVTTTATCKALGVRTYTATVTLDGVAYTDITTKELPLAAHTLTETKSKAATCTEPGNRAYWSCDKCGKYFSDANGETEIAKDSWIIPASHTLTRQEAVEATCTAAGNIEYWTCSACNKYFSDAEGKTEIAQADTVTAKIAHTLTAHAAVPATCTEAGNSAYWSCSKCGKYFSDASGETEIAKDSWIIPASHTLTRHEAVEATCTAAGNIEYWTCSACNKYFSDAEGKTEIAQADTVTAKIAHTLTAHAAVPATCTEAGNSAYWSCSKCGKYFSDASGETEVNKDSWTIPSTEHKNLTKKAEEKPATCEEDGNIAYWYCPDCGRYFSDAEATEVIAGDSWIIEALGHQMEQVPAKAHTCTEDGVIGHYHCTRCDGRFSDSAGKEPLQDNSWVDPAGHDLTHVAAVEPTCAEAGTKEHWHCAVCGKNFSDEEGKTELDDVTIPTVSHTLEQVYAHAPCTEPGNSAYWKCTACGRLYTDQAATKETTIEEVTIPATGSHDTQNMSKIDAQEATCTEAGNVEYWYCGNCQKDYDASGNEITDLSTVVVMSLGHQWSVTWKWSGYTGATASFVCGRDSSHTESLVASQTDITSEVTTPATCTAAGVRTYTAKVTLDGTAYTDTATETLSLAAHTLTETKAKEATCTEPGNSTYWTCSVCGKYFSDAGGNTEIENNSWIINATDHEWGTPAYDWAEDYSKVTAYRVCVNDASHKQTETVDTVSKVTKAATCEVKGETTYTAAFTNTAFTEQTKTVANIDAMGHTWGDTPVWKWDGYTAATATFTCTVDGCGGTNPVTATITDEVTKNPTCVTDGERTYTAKVTLDGEEYTDSKTEVISATGHSWNEPTYEWSADNSKVKAIRTCANDSGEYESQEVETTMETTPATCSATGKTTYTATFSDEAFATQTKEVTLSIDSENHDWENTDWVWADDYSSAKVTFACRHNSSHTASVEVSGDDITVERTEPTCTEAGEAVYRGSVTYGNATANAENHVELEATGHATPNGWKHDENAHWQECPNCGQVLGESAAHAWDDGVTASGGKTVYTCTVCGDQKAEEQPTLAQRIEKGLQKLLAGIRYSFGSGTHTVSGDTTVYAGDQEFYVRVEGEYTVN